jgi:hypothetical protein
MAAIGAPAKISKAIFQPFIPSPTAQSQRIMLFFKGMLIGD